MPADDGGDDGAAVAGAVPEDESGEQEPAALGAEVAAAVVAVAECQPLRQQSAHCVRQLPEHTRLAAAAAADYQPQAVDVDSHSVELLFLSVDQCLQPDDSDAGTGYWKFHPG